MNMYRYIECRKKWLTNKKRSDIVVQVVKKCRKRIKSYENSNRNKSLKKIKNILD